MRIHLWKIRWKCGISRWYGTAESWFANARLLWKRVKWIICDIHRNLVPAIWKASSDLFMNQALWEREEILRSCFSETGTGISVNGLFRTASHRNDLCFLVNGIDIRNTDRRDSERTTALSLKLFGNISCKEKSENTCNTSSGMMYFQSWTAAVQYLLDRSIHDIQTWSPVQAWMILWNHQFHINKIFKGCKRVKFLISKNWTVSNGNFPRIYFSGKVLQTNINAYVKLVFNYGKLVNVYILDKRISNKSEPYWQPCLSEKYKEAVEVVRALTGAVKMFIICAWLVGICCK